MANEQKPFVITYKAFSTSKKVQKQRKLKSTKKELSHSTKSICRSETFQACKTILGATSENVNQQVTGMKDTPSSKVNPKVLSKCALSSKKYVVNQIEIEATFFERYIYHFCQFSHFCHHVSKQCNRGKNINFILGRFPFLSAI